MQYGGGDQTRRAEAPKLLTSCHPELSAHKEWLLWRNLIVIPEGICHITLATMSEAQWSNFLEEDLGHKLHLGDPNVAYVRVVKDCRVSKNTASNSSKEIILHEIRLRCLGQKYMSTS